MNLIQRLFPGLFYGWVVVGAAFAVMFAGFGAAYTFPAFFVPLSEEFGATRANISLIFSVAGFLYFSLGAISGPLTDRIGPRRVVGFGLACVVFGLLAASRGQSLIWVILGYGLGVGVGVGFSYVPVLGVVQRWFLRQRGRASGLAVMGIGVATIAAPPLATYLIDAFGWRETYLVLAVAVALLALVCVVLLYPSPASLGLLPDGDITAVAVGKDQAPVGVGIGATLRDRRFWLLYFAGAFYSLGIFAPFVHLAAMAVDQGFTVQQGAWLVALIGLGSTLGRFALGGMADRFGRGRSLGIAMGVSGFLMVYWLAAEGFLALAVFAVLFGLCYGGFVALIPAFAMDIFGVRAAGSLLGLLYTSVALSVLLGPTLAGLAFDLTGSYALPIAGFGLANLVAGFIILRLDQAQRRAIAT